MSKKELICKELDIVYTEGEKLAVDFQRNKIEYSSFAYNYQMWYTKALKAVESLAPDRYAEFRGYYEIDTKRKTLGYGTYVIQDYLKGVVPAGHAYLNFNSKEQVIKCLLNQLTIFNSITERVNSIVANIESELYAELQDNEIIIAKRLAKVSLRAAGALMGVVIEGHLQKIATKHKIDAKKKNPIISDLNDPLKNANIIDTPTWRKITYLADIRNICSHKKDIEPTKEQVDDLIQGAEWLIKNVF